jgi:ComF family protein
MGFILCGFEPKAIAFADSICQHFHMIASRVLDVLVPGRCLLCRARAPLGICVGCDRDLPAIEGACARCAIPLQTSCCQRDNGEYCGACIRNPPPFDRAIAALNYMFPTTVLVQRFKFNRSFASGAVLARRLVQAIEPTLESSGVPELLVPVPLHPGRRFARIFNQAEVLALDVGKALAIPVKHDVLRRIRRTPSQTGLSADERRRNVRGAISSCPVKAQHVALVDDVMTTGATMSECARALKRSGASEVSVWAPARAG